jgi:hypothetical protein
VRHVYHLQPEQEAGPRDQGTDERPALALAVEAAVRRGIAQAVRDLVEPAGETVPLPRPPARQRALPDGAGPGAGEREDEARRYQVPSYEEGGRPVPVRIDPAAQGQGTGGGTAVGGIAGPPAPDSPPTAVTPSLAGAGILSGMLNRAAAGNPARIPRPGPVRPVAVPVQGGDARTMSILPQYAKDLSESQLATELDLLDRHLATLPTTSPEYQAAQQNQRILQEEQVRRMVQGNLSRPGETVAVRHRRFKQAVLLAAQHRLTQNQENLAQWRDVIERQLTAIDLQIQVLAQSAADLEQVAQAHGGMRAYLEWAGQHNPYMRAVEEHWARGEWRACTGCHETVRADMRGKLEPHVGPAWMSPAERLGAAAGTSPWSGPGGFGGEAAVRVRAAVARIRPIVAPLGEQGYRIIPDDVFSLRSGATPEKLRSEILRRLDRRRGDYAELGRLIAKGEISYLQMLPILQDLLPMADAEVRQAVEDDIASERRWSYIRIGGTIILALLSLLFPPLAIVVGAIGYEQGRESFQQGYAYHLSTGTTNVFTREQQDAAIGLMLSGLATMAMSAVSIAMTTPGLLDMAATRAITASDLAIARGLAQRAMTGPIPEAELLALQQPGLVGRLGLKWADLRKFQILYRGQAEALPEILSPVARQSGVAASRQLYDAMKAQGLSDLEIAGFTARWSGQPVPGMGGLPAGGVGIPTTRLPNIAAGFAESPSGVIYVLRVPKGAAVEVGTAGWGAQSAVEQEWVIFHQIPNGYVVRVLPPAKFPAPLRFDLPPGVGPSLISGPSVP